MIRLAVLAALAASPALAQSCHPNARIALGLIAQRGHQVVASAETTGGGRILWTVNDAGEWMMHAVQEDGRICLMGDGAGWVSTASASGDDA